MDQFNDASVNPQNTDGEAAPTVPQYTPAAPQYAPAAPQYTSAAPQYAPAAPQYAPGAPQYAPQPPVSVYVAPPAEEQVGIGSWFGTFILEAIPLLNLIMYIVWACGGTRKPSLQKYAIARLIFWPVIILVMVILSAAMGGLGALMAQLPR